MTADRRPIRTEGWVVRSCGILGEGFRYRIEAVRPRFARVIGRDAPMASKSTEVLPRRGGSRGAVRLLLSSSHAEATMLGRLFSNVVRRATSAPVDLDQSVEAAQREVETLAFPAMVPLQPPPAQNDDPLSGLCQVVEDDLRMAGYLR